MWFCALLTARAYPKQGLCVVLRLACVDFLAVFMFLLLFQARTTTEPHIDPVLGKPSVRTQKWVYEWFCGMPGQMEQKA